MGRRREKEDEEDDSISWSSIYSQYLDVINSDSVDLLGPLINNENEIMNEKNKDELLEKDEKEEYRFD